MAQGSDWVIPPAGSGEINLAIEIADDANLTPEIQQALEMLMQALAMEESVQGYALPVLAGKCDGGTYIRTCDTKCVVKVSCSPVIRLPF